LGRGTFDKSEDSGVIESLLDVQILKVFAGGCGCFAIAERKQGHERLVQELIEANRAEDPKITKEMVNLGDIYIHSFMQTALQIQP